MQLSRKHKQADMLLASCSYFCLFASFFWEVILKVKIKMWRPVTRIKSMLWLVCLLQVVPNVSTCLLWWVDAEWLIPLCETINMQFLVCVRVCVCVLLVSILHVHLENICHSSGNSLVVHLFVLVFLMKVFSNRLTKHMSD